MNKLRIVFGTNNGKDIVKHHFGDSKKFVLYELDEDGNRRMIKTITNEAKDMEEKKHGDDNKRASVLNQLGQVDVMVAGALSPNFVKINKNTMTIPCVSKVSDINKFLDIFVGKFEDYRMMIEKKRKDNIIPKIPLIEED